MKIILGFLFFFTFENDFSINKNISKKDVTKILEGKQVGRIRVNLG